MKAHTLIMSEFLRVFSIIDLNAFEANNIGNHMTSIKNAIQSNNNFGNVNMRKYGKKIKTIKYYILIRPTQRTKRAITKTNIHIILVMGMVPYILAALLFAYFGKHIITTHFNKVKYPIIENIIYHVPSNLT